MKGISLSSNPNWFLPRVCSCSDSGLVAYGTRQDIVLLKASTKPPEYVGILTGHDGKITSVAVSRNGSRIVSSAEDLSVRIWDVENQTEIAKYQEHTARISCVDWVTGGTSHKVVSGDENGTVIFTHDQTGKSQSFTPLKASITILTCSPASYNKVAVGYRTGAIIIIDQQGTILQKFRNHENEIQGLCWAPFTGRKFGNLSDDSDEKEDHCVLSVSRDNKVFVWSSLAGKSLASFKIPIRGRYRNRQQRHDNKAGNFNTVNWPEYKHHMLICSSGGDLAAFLLEIDGSVSQPQYISGDEGNNVHTKPVFTLCSVGKNLISVSMDRQICISSLSTGKVIQSIPTLGGLPFSIQFSPFDPTCLAVGTGDGQIRLWKVGNEQNPYMCSYLFQGIREKVTTLEWHPEEEGFIAVGTDEGRVGFFVMSRPFSVFSTYHSKSIHKVVWGLPCGKYPQEGTYYIYSCGGDGTILMHNPKQRERDSVNINSIIFASNPTAVKLPQRTDISWKIDTEIVAIGNDDGSVEIFKAPDLVALLIIQSHTKAIACLKWHLSHLSMSLQKSAFSLWLAASTSHSQVHIYNCSDINLSPPKDKLTEITTQVKTVLSGHGTRVNSIAWSPHQDGLIATASFDGTAQVWDATTGEFIANFRGHSSRVLDVEWCPLDPNKLFSSSSDQSVQQWLMNEQTETAPPIKDKKGNKQEIGKDDQENGNDQPKENSETDKGVGKSKTQTELLEGADTNENVDQKENEETILRRPPQVRKLQPKRPAPVKRSKKKKQRSTKSWFPVSCSAENRGKLHSLKDCENLAKMNCKKVNFDYRVLEAEMADQETTHLGFFTDRLKALDMLQAESLHHCNNENLEYSFMMNVWQGNMNEVTKIATHQQQLSDWMIALSPMISTTVWKRMCEAYAKQLIEEEEIHHAVLFLLAVHKVHDAVMLFSQHGYHREAVSLAKVRLAPNDPILKACLEKWAISARSDGNIELAAKCLLGAGQPLEAARLLAQRADPANLAVAATIAFLYNNTNQAVAYANRCIQEACMHLEWKPALDVCSKIMEVRSFAPLLQLHECLCKDLHSFLTALRLSSAGSNVPSDNKPFLPRVAKNWENTEENEQSIMIRRSLSSYKQIQCLGVGDQNTRPGRHLIYSIAVELVLSILAARGQRSNLAMLHLTEALNLPWATKSNSVSIGMVALLWPFGCDSPNTIFSESFTVSDECSLHMKDMALAWYSLAQLAAIDYKINKAGKQDAVELELTPCVKKEADEDPSKHVDNQEMLPQDSVVASSDNQDSVKVLKVISTSSIDIDETINNEHKSNSFAFGDNECKSTEEIIKPDGNPTAVNHDAEKLVHTEMDHTSDSLQELVQSLINARKEELHLETESNVDVSPSEATEDHGCKAVDLLYFSHDEISAQSVKELAINVMRPDVMRYILLKSSVIDISYHCESISELELWIQESKAENKLLVEESIPDSSSNDGCDRRTTEEFLDVSDGMPDEFIDMTESENKDSEHISGSIKENNAEKGSEELDGHAAGETALESEAGNNLVHEGAQVPQIEPVICDITQGEEEENQEPKSLKSKVFSDTRINVDKVLEELSNQKQEHENIKSAGANGSVNNEQETGNSVKLEIIEDQDNPNSTAEDTEVSTSENSTLTDGLSQEDLIQNIPEITISIKVENEETDNSNNEEQFVEEEDSSATLEEKLGKELMGLRMDKHADVFPDPRYACSLVKTICTSKTGEEWEDLKAWVEEWENEHCKEVTVSCENVVTQPMPLTLEDFRLPVM